MKQQSNPMHRGYFKNPTCEHSSCGKTGILSRCAQGVTNLPNERIHEGIPPGIKSLFFYDCGVAQLTPSRTGVVGRHPTQSCAAPASRDETAALCPHAVISACAASLETPDRNRART